MSALVHDGDVFIYFRLCCCCAWC